MMAAYVGVWLFAYVVAFPLFVLQKLWSYREDRKKKEEEEAGKENRELVDLRFLLSDYKLTTPVLLWEGESFRTTYTRYKLICLLYRCRDYSQATAVGTWSVLVHQVDHGDRDRHARFNVLPRYTRELPSIQVTVSTPPVLSV
jgi:hypothetical protein